MPLPVSEEVYGLNIQINTSGGVENRPGTDILTQMGPVATGAPPVSLHPTWSIYSPSRAFRLYFQPDSVLALQYADTATLPHWGPDKNWSDVALTPDQVTWVTFWATNTKDYNLVRLDMQSDGNLIASDSDGFAIWSTGTGGNPGAFFRVLDNGNMVINTQSDQFPWQSNTSVSQSKGANP